MPGSSHGTRSFGPVRATIYAGADYPQHANATIVTFAMIETATALDHLDDILSVEGLDAIYIGPSDLSLSLGCRIGRAINTLSPSPAAAPHASPPAPAARRSPSGARRS